MVDWLRKAIFYEIYPTSFMDSNGDGIGDFNGIKSKLSYIKKIGCNALWLNPCFRSPFFDGGYDISDYYSPDERFGTMQEMDAMLSEAKNIGIKIILDLVPGHTSEQNPIFIESGLPEKNSFSDRFIWTDSVWSNYPEYRLIKGRHQRNSAYMVNFFDFQPALNYGFNKITHPLWQLSYKDKRCFETRDFIIDIMRFWLKKGYDGFRVDMADSLVKNDEDKSATIEVWKYIFSKIRPEFPEAVFISEWGNSVRAIEAGFDADFYLDHKDNGYHNLCRRIYDGINYSFFDEAGKGDITRFLYDYLRRYLPTKEKGMISFISGNHDIERLADFYDQHQLKLIFGFLLTMPGVPFIYYGDEIGMRNGIGIKSKDGGFERTAARTPMLWNDEKNRGFSDSDVLYLPVNKINENSSVIAQENQKESLLNTIIDLIKIRTTNDAFCSNEFSVEYAESESKVFVYKRNRFIIFINPSLMDEKIKLKYNSLKNIYSVGNQVIINSENIIIPSRSFHIEEMVT